MAYIDITLAKKKREEELAKKFPEMPASFVSRAAEIATYCDTVIPSYVRYLTIFDFDGYSRNGKTVLPVDVTLKAKQKIVKYCWGDISLDDLEQSSENIHGFLKQHSKLSHRFSQGSNLIICGNNANGSGKTMIAAIVMREAINLRYDSNYSVNTYGWINYQRLKSLLKDKERSNNFDSEHEVDDYQSCTWLVVDDIVEEFDSLQSQKYLASVFDSFFMTRFDKKLPTILVFRFDIRDIDPTERFGVGIGKIIDADNSMKISLSV